MLNESMLNPEDSTQSQILFKPLHKPPSPPPDLIDGTVYIYACRAKKPTAYAEKHGIWQDE